MKLIREIESRWDKRGILRKWAIFRCDSCNQEVERKLENGLKQKSCGCKRYEFSKGDDFNYKHGEIYTRLYTIWALIKQRCLNPKATGYKNYGGRGITICDEWLAFIPFRDWALSNGYQENLQINRIENDGNYEPSNCEWETRTKNQRNRRKNVIKSLEIANEIRYLDSTGKYTQQELSEKYNISFQTVSFIINNKQWKNI